MYRWLQPPACIVCELTSFTRRSWLVLPQHRSLYLITVRWALRRAGIGRVSGAVRVPTPQFHNPNKTALPL